MTSLMPTEPAAEQGVEPEEVEGGVPFERGSHSEVRSSETARSVH